MTRAILLMELRLRARTTASAAAGLIMLTAAVGALFPAFKSSIGNVRLPSGVDNLLGGSNFATIGGWLQTEVVSVYGPLVVAAVAITAAASLAADEEAHVLAVLLTQPVSRTRLLLAKAAAIGVLLIGLAVAIFIGLLLAVAFAGGGSSVGNLAAVALHLLLLGSAVGALALALAATTGQRSLTTSTSAAVVLVMFLVNGFAPAVDSVSWLKYLSVFYYYEGQHQITTGAHPAGLTILAVLTAVLTAVAVAGFARRDLRG